MVAGMTILKFRGWQNFSVKDKVQNILVLVGHIVSLSTIQLCHCSSSKATIENMRKYIISIAKIKEG